MCQWGTEHSETHSQALKRRYSVMEKQNAAKVEHIAAMEDILYRIKTRSEPEALEIFRRLRSHTDVATTLSLITSGDTLLQLLLVPETRRRYEFPYINRMPAGLVADNPYLDSLIYSAATLYDGDDADDGDGASRRAQQHAVRCQGVAMLVDKFGKAEHESLYLKPFHAADLAEPRLSKTKPSAWTSVCDDDAFMNGLLAAWFRSEYSSQSPVHKNFFLEDMASQRSTFCSSLLVNAVLAYACICSRLPDRPEYRNPHSYSYRFLVEAKRIWELEAIRPCITTIQAGIILNLVHNLDGLDEIGRAYGEHSVTLASALGLFGGAVEEVRSKRDRDGRAFTAWALFSFET
ncbi:hypothetical protein CDD83_9949 [Cordyceps sp. RAO-2017]|nr:hypothetical protein CDD83_9949 [Cordyceps sp. RAO-2017]